MLELSEFIIGKTIIFGIFLQNKTAHVLASKKKSCQLTRTCMFVKLVICKNFNQQLFEKVLSKQLVVVLGDEFKSKNYVATTKDEQNCWPPYYKSGQVVGHFRIYLQYTRLKAIFGKMTQRLDTSIKDAPVQKIQILASLAGVGRTG